MIGITGATGQLGQYVIRGLLEKGVPASSIVALVRSPDKAAHFVAQGVQVRYADYSKPETLDLSGIKKLLLISSSDFQDRFGQHKNIVQAAQKAGVEFLGYTSILKANTTPMLIADDHKRTELLIQDSGIKYAFFRNGWYMENYNIAQALEHGAILGAAGNGRVSAATRADYAAATVAVLSQDKPQQAIYELAGDSSFTLAELAAQVGQQSGKTVVYNNMPVEVYAQTLQSFGLPASFAAILANSDQGIEQGHLENSSKTLSTLIGKATTTLEEFVKSQIG